MEEDKIQKRREYMKNYYLNNKERYKNGKYVKKKAPKPQFHIVRKTVTIIFE
jgi:hypothetical protein